MTSVTLTRVDPISYGKIQAVFAAIVGFAYGIFAAFILGTLGILGGSTMVISGGLAIAMPFFGIIGGVILGFIFAAISAIVYNRVAGAIGGVTIDLGSKPTVINSINKMSLAKIAAVVALIVFIVIAIIMVAAFPVIIGMIGGGIAASSVTGQAATTGISSTLTSELQGVSGTVEVLLLIIIPIVGVIGGFIYGFLYALIYDFLAGEIGGIKFTLSAKPSTITAVDPMSYAKMSASIAAVIALITSLIDFVIHHTIISALSVIGIPIFDFVIGFVVTFIFAWIYNAIAPRIGGIQIVLK
ncbi:MAG: hypothetical protein KGH78_00325 [Candidatus Micrarchaeota archaeon]|nr:hypothetical protein [Candidatus Micrarchaeota archaeon]MDE1846459.1 hypothetical protein [Candidatus Micrarchaeota archaeon]